MKQDAVHFVTALLPFMDVRIAAYACVLCALKGHGAHDAGRSALCDCAAGVHGCAHRGAFYVPCVDHTLIWSCPCPSACCQVHGRMICSAVV